jgi:hypothetical protein
LIIFRIKNLGLLRREGGEKYITARKKSAAKKVLDFSIFTQGYLCAVFHPLRDNDTLQVL